MDSILDFNLDDVQDPKSVEAGEYPLTVINGEVRHQKPEADGDSDFALIRFRIEGQDAKTITHVLMYPDTGDEQEDTNRKRRIKQFVRAFNAPWPFVVTEENDRRILDGFSGLTGHAILTEKTSDEFGTQNNISRFIVPAS